MQKTTGVLTLTILGILGQAAACWAGDELPETGEKRDTLLYVRTDPPGAKVLLNGKELGVSNGLFPVEPGTGTILVELEGRQPGQRQVIIRANGVTRVELKLKPQTKAYGAHSIGRPSQGTMEPVSSTVGVKFFRPGDSITITEVKATSPDLKNGDKMIVSGYYTLASEPRASLSFFTTATTGSGIGPIRPEQTIGIANGEGRFELSKTLDCDGYHHVTFYSVATGKPFGGLYFGTAKRMEEIKHWDVRSWYTAIEPGHSSVELQSEQKTDVKAGRAAAEASALAAIGGPEDARFTGHFPQGTVELVGVTDYPTSAKSTWWKPNGSTAHFAPLATEPTGWSLSPKNKPIAFFFRFQNLSSGASHPLFDINPNTGMWGSTRVVDDYGRIVPDRYVFSAELGPSAETAGFRVGVAMGAWETVMTQKVDSLGTSSFNRDGRQYNLVLKQAAEIKTVDSPQATQVTLAEVPASDKWLGRLVAVDSDKSEHASRINYKNDIATAVFKRMPLYYAKEFRFQICPYYWVEFKNVAIKAGQKTDVKVLSAEKR